MAIGPEALMDSEAGSHRQINWRLFDANDPESTGIVRFRTEALDNQSPCGTTEDKEQLDRGRPGLMPITLKLLT